MAYKNYLFIALALLLVLPMVSSAKDLGVEDNEKYFINETGLYKIGDKTKVKDKGDVWIDKKVGNTYHVDSKVNDDVDNITLHFHYDIQPDYIRHINHKKQYVRTYFPTQWTWTPDCLGEECSTSGGTVEVMVSGIDKGTGSNTFPIGVTGPTWANDGQFYGEFDSESSVVRSQESASLDSMDNFTISIFVKNNDIDEDQVIIGRAESATNESWVIFAKSDEKIKLQLYPNCNDTGIESDTSSSIGIGDWTHITVTYNNTHSIIYFDGVSNTIYAYNNTLCKTSSDLTIGNYRSQANRYYNGSIDEVLIYNRSISQAEITALYNNYTVTANGVDRTGTPSTDGLVLNINFDDFSVADNSGNENHGTNTNVTFGVVEDNTITLVENTDYSINNVSGLVTLLNNNLQWKKIEFNWSYIRSLTRVDLNSIKSNYSLSLVNTAGQLPNVGTIIGLAILLVILIGLLVFAIEKMLGVSSEGGSFSKSKKFKGSSREFA